MITKAIAAIPLWQSQVSTAQAAKNMTNGLTKAGTKATAVATKVNGAGSASLLGRRARRRRPWRRLHLVHRSLAQLRSAAEVQTLNTTNPRGTRAQNRARQAAYDAWVDSQAGNFRVK